MTSINLKEISNDDDDDDDDDAKINDIKGQALLKIYDLEETTMKNNNAEVVGRNAEMKKLLGNAGKEVVQEEDGLQTELVNQTLDKIDNTGTNVNMNDRPKVQVKVLIWSKIAGYLDWLRDDFTSAAKTMCPNVECILTTNRQEIQSVDAVFFHGPTHSPSDWPKNKPLVSEKFRNLKNGNSNPRIGQPIPYIFFTLEQPYYVKNLLPPHGDKVQKYASHFDYTMHYNLDATIHVTTIHPDYMAEDFFKLPKYWNSFAEKDGYGENNAVVAFVSNCKNAGATERLKFMEELSKYIPLHSYGKCLHNKDEPSLKEGEKRSDSKKKIL